MKTDITELMMKVNRLKQTRKNRAKIILKNIKNNFHDIENDDLKTYSDTRPDGTRFGALCSGPISTGFSEILKYK